MNNETVEPITSSKEIIKDSISKKDKISLLISIIALVISATTFGITRWEAYQKEKRATESNSFSAFQFGKGFSVSYLVYVYTREGNPEKVEAAKKEALAYANQNQAYAEALDLRMDLQSLIENYKYNGGVIPETPFSIVETRLKNNHPKSVVATFSAAWWLVWLNFNAQAAYEAHPEYLPTFEQDYTEAAALINKNLSDLGINKKLSTSLPNLEIVKSETLEALEALEKAVSFPGSL